MPKQRSELGTDPGHDTERANLWRTRDRSKGQRPGFGSQEMRVRAPSGAQLRYSAFRDKLQGGEFLERPHTGAPMAELFGRINAPMVEPVAHFNTLMANPVAHFNAPMAKPTAHYNATMASHIAPLLRE